MRVRDLHVGGQTRKLKVTTRSTFNFKTWMPGNLGMREALLLHQEPAVVAIALAAMLLHEDSKMTPARAMGWVDEEPARYPEIADTVIACAEDYFRDVGIIEKPAGEAVSSATTTSPTSGTDSSKRADATGSTPGSSSI